MKEIDYRSLEQVKAFSSFLYEFFKNFDTKKILNQLVTCTEKGFEGFEVKIK